MSLFAVSDAVWLGLIQLVTLALTYWIKKRQDSADKQRVVMTGKIDEVHGLVNGMARKREDVATSQGAVNTAEATAQGKLNTAEAVAQGVVNSAQAFQEGVNQGKKDN